MEGNEIRFVSNSSLYSFTNLEIAFYIFNKNIYEWMINNIQLKSSLWSFMFVFIHEYKRNYLSKIYVIFYKTWIFPPTMSDQ